MQLARTKISTLTLASVIAAIAVGCLLLIFVSGLKNHGDWDVDTTVLRIGHLRPFRPDPHQTVLLNPAYHQAIYAAWEGLAEPDPLTGGVRPAAAEGWRFSDDGRQLTVRLRPDGRWANGDLVSAHDFVRGWRRSVCARDTVFNGAMQKIRGAAGYRQGEVGAEQFGVRAIDDLTLQVDLIEPDRNIVSEMCDSAWMPLHASSLTGPDPRIAEIKLTEVFGNGPHGKIRTRAHVVELNANPWHWASGTSPWRRIVFHHVERAAAGAALLRARAVDCLVDLPEPIAERMCGDRPGWRQAMPENQVEVVNLNTARGPLRDARVRRALSLALARQEEGAAINAATWLPPELQEKQAVYQSDAATARALLAEAGYPGGVGFPVLRWLHLPSNAPNPVLRSCTEDWWRELGIRVYLRPSRRQEYRDLVTAKEHDLALVAWKGSSHDPLSLFDALGSEGMITFTNWRDERLDQLKRQAVTASGEERLRLLREMAELIQREVPAFPVRHRDRVLWRSPLIEWPQAGGSEERIRSWRRLDRS